jgi:hypothetical protein
MGELMPTYRIEFSDPEYGGSTFMCGIEGDTDQAAIETFFIDSINEDWITRIELVSIKRLPDHI